MIYWAAAVVPMIGLSLIVWSLFGNLPGREGQAFSTGSGLPAPVRQSGPQTLQRTEPPDDASFQSNAGASEESEPVSPSRRNNDGPAGGTGNGNGNVQLPPVSPIQEDTGRKLPVVKEIPLVMIDPGHQRKGNNEPEQVGPDTNAAKPKVSSGTTGVRTKKPEYVLNLEVSERLKDELTARGIRVAMTRETHDVNLSNKQRAELGNDAGASLVVRIHADGDASPKTKGLSVLYPSPSVPAVKPIAESSRQAASLVLEQLESLTDSSDRGLSARTDLSGFNWSRIPVILVELGFMTNPEEDERLSDPDYQRKLAKGIAEGIERFLKTGGE